MRIQAKAEERERGELPDWQTANTGHVYWYTERNTARIT